MPIRIPFTIVGCSGEQDPEYPCQELQFNAPESRGWCTPRYCQYPQEFSIKLDQPSQLFQIQLLSHEFKIASKIDISVGVFMDGAQDPANVQWKRLGHLSFDSNERSQLSARELKSVVLNGVPAHLVRFQFLRCHQNQLNTYGQVGLIALNLIGDPLSLPLTTITNTAQSYPTTSAPSLAGLSLHGHLPAAPTWSQPHSTPVPAAQPTENINKSNSAGVPGEALAAELNVDVVTAKKIMELQDHKKKAIDNEDYDEAKRLKAGIDKLKAVGTKIAQLETRKRSAVEAEDYDLAKELKMEVDKLRVAAYSTLSGDGLIGEFSNSFVSPVPSRRNSMVGTAPGGRRSMHNADEAVLPQQKPTRGGADIEGAAVSPAPRSKAAAQDKWLDYDERPAQAKGVYQFDAAAAAAAEPPGSLKAKTGKAAGDLAPKGFPADLPVPEPLKPADSKDAQPLLDLVGDYVGRAMFSKTWQLREAALQKVAADISDGSLEGLEGDSDAFKTLTRSMARMVKDKVAGVYSAALRLLKELVEHQASCCSARDVQTAIGELLPLLVERACDLNARTREQATELLLYLAGVKQAGLASSTHPVVKPMKSQASGKVVLGRLQLLSTLLPAIGMAGKGGGEGFQLDAVMDFVGAAFGNSNADVRAAAVHLTLQVYDVVGPSVQRYLPADLNPKVKEQIEAGMIKRPPAGAALPRSAAARPQPPKSAAPSKKPAAAAGAAGRGPPATATHSPPAAAALQPAAPAPAATAYPPAPGSPGMPPPGEDDPALYEAELRSREARLGPSHPDVADALSNLAIIYNQRGDTSQALPLYERALAIWEAACGADHPDVAHTLTDIAVIHLEQGRDDIGRPLLERALAIQEKHLGPDHPDVVAIRDVLTEEL